MPWSLKATTARHLQAQHILVATGGMPTVHPIEGKELTGTSDHILNLKERPNKYAVVCPDEP